MLLNVCLHVGVDPDVTAEAIRSLQSDGAAWGHGRLVMTELRSSWPRSVSLAAFDLSGRTAVSCFTKPARISLAWARPSRSSLLLCLCRSRSPTPPRSLPRRRRRRARRGRTPWPPLASPTATCSRMCASVCRASIFSRIQCRQFVHAYYVLWITSSVAATLNCLVNLPNSFQLGFLCVSKYAMCCV